MLVEIKKNEKIIKPIISVNARQKIYFNEAMCRQMGVIAKMRVSFLQDNINPSVWAIAKTNEKSGRRLGKIPNGKGLIINSDIITQKIRASFGATGNTPLRFIVENGGEGLFYLKKVWKKSV